MESAIKVSCRCVQDLGDYLHHVHLSIYYGKVSQNGQHLYYHDYPHDPLNIPTPVQTTNPIQYPIILSILPSDEVVPVRLADGSSNNEGRLEVLYQGLWGTVCDDYFDVADAEVACRQLGYQTGTVAWFLPGSGNIWLTNMSCSGSELGLNECSHAGWGPQHGCSHDEDVGVVCS